MSVVCYGSHRSDGHGRGGSSVRPDEVTVRGSRQHGVQQRPGGGAGGQDTAKDNYLQEEIQMREENIQQVLYLK